MITQGDKMIKQNMNRGSWLILIGIGVVEYIAIKKYCKPPYNIVLMLVRIGIDADGLAWRQPICL